jgi:predicted ribosome quality control (RQC) complex YloA/Tae2 family protein
MKEELANPSRADQYEAFGHLLMASQSLVEPGLDSVTLEDVISGSGMATVKLDPLLGVVQNAERYYDKARKVRQSRITSDARIEKATSEVDRLVDLQNAIQELKTRDDVVRFKKDRADDLSWLSGSKDGGELQVPFRQFDIGDGYLVWVGRNATQNDELTLHAARKYDYWLHARGVAGSHVVLRVPIRNVRPPRSVIEKAAAIAAYFSKARTSSYAPVIFTEKKFVRKPRKSPAGSVLVEREEVIMVEPGIPSD